MGKIVRMILGFIRRPSKVEVAGFGLNTLVTDLIRDEDWRTHLYQDSLGIWTIGVGYNIQEHGLPDDIILDLLKRGIAQAEKDVDQLVPNWRQLSQPRQRVLLNMAFNLGRARLATFEKFIAAVIAGDHEEAVRQMIDSKWHDQVGRRAILLERDYQRG